MLVSWERCHCAPARAAHPDRHAWGHLTVECAVTGCRWKWYSPPHEPGPVREAARGGHPPAPTRPPARPRA